MPEELILKFLEHVGFPAAVCFYTLIKIHPAMRDLTVAINSLGKEVEKRERHQLEEIAKLKEKVAELGYKLESLARRE